MTTILNGQAQSTDSQGDTDWSMHGITHEVVYLSSDDAAKWLENYKGPNRRVSETQVARFQSDMEAGRWHFEGAPLKLSKSNRLQDGQHRLTALANVPGVKIPFLVVRGLPEDAQFYMDQGQARTVGQQLELRGVPNSARCAAVVKLYLDWTNGRLFKSTRHATSKPETTEWVFNNTELLEKLNETDYGSCDASPSVSGAFALAILQMAPVRAFNFFHKLTTGTGLSEGDPILALDRRLRNIRRFGQKVSQRELLAMFIKTWNAWVMGDRIQKIQLGALTEANYPELIHVQDTGYIEGQVSDTLNG